MSNRRHPSPPRCLTLVLALLCLVPLAAQQHTPTPNDIHPRLLDSQRRPAPFPHLRESDILWATTVWKRIPLSELFNLHMYFPLDQDDRSGRKSLAYLLWEGMESGELPIYDDDELLVPIDAERFVRNYTAPDTITLEIGYDENDEELFETVIRPHFFDGTEIYFYDLREAWFIGKADARQDSRRMALAPLKDIYRVIADAPEPIYLGRQPLFWIPMQHPAVRAYLARHSAYVEGGQEVMLPSWDLLFLSQRYSAYITRESNRFNRAVTRYLTGEDAILEAAEIEQRLLDLGDDMWEY